MENLNKNQKIILGIVAGIIILAIGYYIMQKNNEYEKFDATTVQTFTNEINTNVQERKKISIHIIGCVVNEGLFELEEGARILDAIKVAGGETMEADFSKVNLAYKLSDGQKVYIPSINEEESQETEYVTTKSGDNVIVENNKGESDMVNINTANQTELETLPGIGPSTALKIIKYREENGKFQGIEDLKNVKGIGESKYDAIKELIEV